MELEKKNDIIKTLHVTVDELTNKNICLVEDNNKISLQKEQVSEVIIQFIVFFLNLIRGCNSIIIE